MAAALLTGIFASVAGLVAAIYLGLTWTGNGMLGQHISIGIFTTLITLFAHSMMMFYFLGKGKAVREAAAEGGLSREYERRIAIARKPVFSIATLAMSRRSHGTPARASTHCAAVGVLACRLHFPRVNLLRAREMAPHESGRVARSDQFCSVPTSSASRSR